MQALLAKSFTPARPIDLPEFLTGRLDVLYRAIDASNTSGKHIVLFGERGIGKTSIARVLAHNVQDAKPGGRRALLASCSTVDDYANIWAKVFKEICISERQFGFQQYETAQIVGRFEPSTIGNDPNDVRLLVQALPNPYLIIIDEFDRVPLNNDARRLMADTIKLFADSDVGSTIVLVGVAESIGELIAEHQSISRNLDQIRVEQMKAAELAEIIDKGFKRVEMTYEDGLDYQIARLSQGYPHYTHLLGLWSGRQAVEEGRTHVTLEHLHKAIPRTLANASGSASQDYEKAVHTSQTTLYKEVLLACALAPKDSLGRFSAVEVREPLRRITGVVYDSGAYQSHLAKFCTEDRGPILRRTGTPRAYRWQFIDPQIIPFIVIRGKEEGLLPD